MRDEHSENVHDFLKRIYIEDSIEQYKRNADLFGNLMIWEDIDNVSAEEWNELWDSVKEKGIKLRTTAAPVLKDKQINIFEKYATEELKGSSNLFTSLLAQKYFFV